MRSKLLAFGLQAQTLLQQAINLVPQLQGLIDMQDQPLESVGTHVCNMIASIKSVWLLEARSLRTLLDEFGQIESRLIELGNDLVQVQRGHEKSGLLFELQSQTTKVVAMIKVLEYLL